MEGDYEMVNVIDDSLQKEAISIIDSVPIEKLPILIQFTRFLSSPAYDSVDNYKNHQSMTARRKRISGRLKGKIWISNYFNEIF